MTDDDFTIEGLDALPGSAADEITDDGFSALVIRRIAQHRRRKAITLGATASIGSAIAGAQLTAIVGTMPAIAATNESVAPFLSAMTPESIATAGVAGLAAIVAWVIPNRV